MSKIADISKNAIEDGAEEFISAYVYRRSEKLAQHFTKDFDSGSEFDDAAETAVRTLIQGGATYIYTGLMNIILDRGLKISGALWSYIVAGAMKKRILEKIKQSKLKGNKAVKALTMVLGSDRTSERIQVAQLIQSNVDSIDSHRFNLQKTHVKTHSNLDNFAGSMTNLRNSAENSILVRFNQKTATGTWENNSVDKKLYEKATGIKIGEAGDGNWSNLYLKLNKYTDYYKSLDGEITNLATVLQKMLIRSGAVTK